jgi:hypothetical protein
MENKPLLELAAKSLFSVHVPWVEGERWLVISMSSLKPSISTKLSTF